MMVFANRLLFRLPGQTDWTDSLDSVRKDIQKKNLDPFRTPIQIKDARTNPWKNLGTMPIGAAVEKFA